MLERIEWKRKKEEEEGEIIAFFRIAVMFVGLRGAGDDVKASIGAKDRRGCGGDAGLNRTVSSESEAKGSDRDEYYKQQYHEIFESDKAKSGKGVYGGANIPHHRQGKNAAPSLVSPPCFLLTATLH
ncbi:hypothetical protein Golob_010117, partial [Gossypium lobatum]|nr:hypothetical protein [Gossypium lobatum]